MAQPGAGAAPGARPLITSFEALDDLRGRARRLLAVFAHPDDESYGVAGTLVRHAAEPETAVVLLCLTSGEASSTLARRGLDRAAVRALREARLAEVAAALRLDALLLPRLPDGALARLPFDTLAAPVREAVRRLEPQVVVAHDARGVNGHPDHVASHWAVRDALRDRPGVRFGCVGYLPEVAEAARPRLIFPTEAREIDVRIELSPDEVRCKERCLAVHEAAMRIDVEPGPDARPPVELYDLFGEAFDPPLASLFDRLGDGAGRG